MGPKTLLAPILAALAVAGAGSAPASAHCRLCDAPATGGESDPGELPLLLEIETGLDFDRIIFDGQGQGSVMIRADGSRVAEGAVGEASARAMVGTAVVRGTPGRLVRIELPQRLELYSLGGGTLVVDEVQSDLPAIPRLDAAGKLSFRFGGRVRLTGNAEGDYRGDLPIDAEYQ